MDKIVLNKVWIKDFERIVRSIYADDVEFINRFHQSAGRGFDAAVKDSVENVSPDSKFFKVETVNGAMVGFFVQAAPIEDQFVLEGFHIIKQFRTAEYLAAFWELVRQTFDNDFYTSISENNVAAAAHLLKNNFTVVGPMEYNGKNFVIFRTSKDQ